MTRPCDEGVQDVRVTCVFAESSAASRTSVPPGHTNPLLIPPTWARPLSPTLIMSSNGPTVVTRRRPSIDIVDAKVAVDLATAQTYSENVFLFVPNLIG